MQETSQTLGAAAERKTISKHSSLTQSYFVVPIAAETTGIINKNESDFLNDASHKVQMATARAPSSFSDYPF